MNKMTGAPARSSQRHVTKLQFAYAALREAIIRCDLKPGERLVIDDLARRFDVSIIPVREALRILESEGFVVSVAHTGTSVAPVSRQLVIEVFAILEGLETVSGRAAALGATAAGVARLDQIVARMDRAIAGNRPGVWAELNTEFHLAVSALSGMPMVDQMLRRALDHWDRVRRHFFTRVFTRRAAAAQREHRRMLEQLRSRDVDGIERTMRAHNRAALHAYLTYLDEPRKKHGPQRKHGGNTGEDGRDTGEHGRDTGEHGRNTGEHGRNTGEHGRNTGEHGRNTGEHGRNTGEHGRNTEEHGRNTEEHGRHAANAQTASVVPL